MKPTLVTGIAREARYLVTADMAPPHLPVQVLSTPAMIGLIEWTCLDATKDHLDDGETTVGTHISVSHTAPAMAGDEVVVSCRLAAIERRRLTFDVDVASPRGKISEGTHQRAVIDSSAFQ